MFTYGMGSILIDINHPHKLSVQELRVDARMMLSQMSYSDNPDSFGFHCRHLSFANLIVINLPI